LARRADIGIASAAWRRANIEGMRRVMLRYQNNAAQNGARASAATKMASAHIGISA